LRRRRLRLLLLAAFLGGARRHCQRRCAVRSLDDRSYTSNENAVSRRPSAVRSVNTSLGLEHRVHSDINPGMNMSMRISNQSGMVCSSYSDWDHIAMLYENWILWFIPNLNHNNILGTLIYFHTQLFMSINVMVWISTFFLGVRCEL
jgi:hypothetical protein